MTKESQSEQRSVRLDKSGEFDLKTFNNFKLEYKHRFDFPFVICVRDTTRDKILEEIKVRLNNSIDQELLTGINEVKKICQLRIMDLVA